ncbi:MAG: protein TonB [Limisphaerales bacterium]|jgi:protein TonB
MSLTVLIILIATFLLIIPIGLPLLLFRVLTSRNKIMGKYEGSDESGSIFVKKYDEASVPRFRTLFLLLGAAGVLATLTMAFTWQPPIDDTAAVFQIDVDDDDDEVIPQTNQTPPPPPPPPPPPEIIEVDDEEEIEEEPEILELEFEDEAEIPEPVYVAPIEVEAEDEPDFFVVVEDMPAFPGGEMAMYKWLGKNIKYPQVAKENGIEGKVFVRFIVNKVGKVTEVEVLRGIGGGCDEEAVRVVRNMPSWKPGKQRGKAVKVQFTIPIHFQLS